MRVLRREAFAYACLTQHAYATWCPGSGGPQGHFLRGAGRGSCSVQIGGLRSLQFQNPTYLNCGRAQPDSTSEAVPFQPRRSSSEFRKGSEDFCNAGHGGASLEEVVVPLVEIARRTA